MKTLQLFAVTCVALVLTPFASASQHAFIWDSVNGMRDLGTLGGDNSYAFGINNRGQVTGWSYLADNVTTHAFIWTAAGGMVDLGVTTGETSSFGEAINASGTVAGGLYDGTSDTIFSWRRGVFTTLPPVSTFDDGHAINDAGYITGRRGIGDGVDTDTQAFLWNPARGSVVLLGALPGGLTSQGYGINRKGDITGESEYSSSTNAHAFLYTKASGMQDIGAIPNSKVALTFGNSVNDNDEIVGSGGTRVSFAFYWSPSTPLILLPALSSGNANEGGAFQILKSGVIVGNSKLPGGAFHAVIWANRTAAPQDLGTLPGGTNSYGRGINNAGQVAGYSDVE